NDVYFEQMATYAFEQKRLVDKKIYPEQGLIGRVFNEKQTIYLSEIPKDYINITSGLGESSPKNLLIVPLLINMEVHGAIEIASFNVIKGFQIEFIEKIGENIASTINNVLVNDKTKTLLRQSREQSELLSNQEEEMRRNIIELKNIQKESDASIYAKRDLLKSLEHILLLVELSADGEILSISDYVPKFFAMSKENLVGKHYSDYSNFVPVDEYKNLILSWEKLANGEEVQTELKVKSGLGKMTNIMVNIVPEFENEKIQRIILMGVELKK
ncbi:MAG: GAF domain-containing protein, partial [Bacteroidales bacterium]|nr:GAF domain-containing protein [Bacteroidales bacterium]